MRIFSTQWTFVFLAVAAGQGLLAGIASPFFFGRKKEIFVRGHIWSEELMYSGEMHKHYCSVFVK